MRAAGRARRRLYQPCRPLSSPCPRTLLVVIICLLSPPPSGLPPPPQSSGLTSPVLTSLSQTTPHGPRPCLFLPSLPSPALPSLIPPPPHRSTVPPKAAGFTNIARDLGNASLATWAHFTWEQVLAAGLHLTGCDACVYAYGIQCLRNTTAKASATASSGSARCKHCRGASSRHLASCNGHGHLQYNTRAGPFALVPPVDVACSTACTHPACVCRFESAHSTAL